MTQIDIRRFTAADRDWLVAQIADAFIAGHDPACEQGWIAWEGETRLGSIFCVRLDTQTAKLRLFQLVPEARGKGLGRTLLQVCTDYARAQGYLGMQLWTHKSHEAACALYRRNGWNLVDEKPVMSFGQHLVEQTFTRKL